MKNVNGLKIVLLTGLAVWLVGMGLLSRVGPSARPVEEEFVLPVYPHADAVSRKSAPNVGYQALWCRVPESYPSMAVLQYYTAALGNDWRPIGATAPRWSLSGPPGSRNALLVGAWEDTEGLRTIEFRMWWQQKQGGGSDVYVSVSRSLNPPRRAGSDTGNAPRLSR